MDNRTDEQKSNNNNNNSTNKKRLSPDQRRGRVLGLYGTSTANEISILLGVSQRTIEGDIQWLKNSKGLARRGILVEELVRFEAEGQRNRLRNVVGMTWDDLQKARTKLYDIQDKLLKLEQEMAEYDQPGIISVDQQDARELLSKAWDLGRFEEGVTMEICLRLQFEHRSAEIILARFYVLAGAYSLESLDDPENSRPKVMFHGMDTDIPEVELQDRNEQTDKIDEQEPAFPEQTDDKLKQPPPEFVENTPGPVEVKETGGKKLDGRRKGIRKARTTVQPK